MKTKYDCNRSIDGGSGAAGFTRLELLVVIAVLGMLAGISVPAWSRPAARSTRAQCMNNLRRIFMAARLYADENGDRLPIKESDELPWDLQRTTASAMEPCGLTRDILYEPALPFQNDEALWSSYSTEYRVISYAMTFPGSANLIATNQNASIVPQPFKIISVWFPAPDPARRVLVADATISAAGQNQTNAASRASYNYTSLQSGLSYVQFRTSHMDVGMPAGGNLGMLDGHVEWRQFADMIPRTTGSSTVFWW